MGAITLVDAEVVYMLQAHSIQWLKLGQDSRTNSKAGMWKKSARKTLGKRLREKNPRSHS